MFLQKPPLGTQLDHSDSLNNPVLDLLLNEGHGNRVNDLSGYGNHGTLHRFDFPPTKASGWNPGMDGVALTFDGVDDYINCGNNPGLNLVCGTIDVLVCPVSFKKQYVIAKRDNSAVGFNIFFGDTGIIECVDGAGNEILTNLSYTLDWQRIVFVINGTTLTPYKNGIPGDDTSIAAFTSNDVDLIIGNRVGSGGDFCFDGSFARARILPRAMSAFEVMRTQINPYAGYL